MLVEQLAHAQPPLKQVMLEWNDKPWTKINSLTSNSLKAGEVVPEGKHLALAQMSPKPALPNKPTLKVRLLAPAQQPHLNYTCLWGIHSSYAQGNLPFYETVGPCTNAPKQALPNPFKLNKDDTLWSPTRIMNYICLTRWPSGPCTHGWIKQYKSVYYMQ